MVASFKDGKVDNRSSSLNLDDLIKEHCRKKEEDLNKFKEFTNRHSPTLHANPVDLALQFTPTGEIHVPAMNGHASRYRLNINQYTQQQHRLVTPPSATTRSPVMFSTPPPPVTRESLSATTNGVVKSMKTGNHHHTQSAGSKVQWTNSKSATPTKA